MRHRPSNTGNFLQSIILYGGSFDPPHKGHINTALSVFNHFNPSKFIFIPCKNQVLKQQHNASSEERMDMLKLALNDYSQFLVDDREITRNTPSYMVDTLSSFRLEYGDKTSIILLMGIDTFMQLPQWHQWQQLLSLCHLLIINRPLSSSRTLSPALIQLLDAHETMHRQELLTNPAGKILLFDAGNYDISSTWLRHQIKRGKPIQPYLPKSVYEFIQAKKLYR